VFAARNTRPLLMHVEDQLEPPGKVLKLKEAAIETGLQCQNIWRVAVLIL
jgi:hypothetical protein